MSEEINITSSNIIGKCDLKCMYNFLYHNSVSTARNNGTNISISYEKKDPPPVTYNSEKYNVSNVRIFSPSVHLFNGRRTNAEILISHNPENFGGKGFNVFIPIRQSDAVTNATNIFQKIISDVSNTAPSSGLSVNIGTLNLNNIVPKKPFVSYISNTGNNNIVFGLIDAIPLSKSTLDTLLNVIQPFAMRPTGSGLYYNSSGPNTTTDIGDGLYISCNPTGSSEETTQVTTEKEPENPYNISNILEDPIVNAIFQIIVACILFLIIFYIWNYSYGIVDGAQKVFGEGAESD
jgi:hypothetical protein